MSPEQGTVLYFQYTNFRQVQKFLKACGPDIVKLHIDIPKPNTIVCQVPNFKFPALRKLNVETDKDLGKNTAILLKYLVEASPNLKCFKAINDGSLFPRDSELFTLPSSVSTLEFFFFGKQEWKFILNSELPKVSKLTVIMELFHNANYLYEVLDKFRETLNELKLVAGDEQKVQLKFPVMETLKVLHFEVSHFWLDEQASNLRACFPKLNNFTLDTNAAGYRLWTSNLVFDQVDKLKLRVLEDRRVGTTWEQTISLKLESAQRTRAAFPNITSLFVTVCAKNAPAIRYIFQEFRQLVRLSLLVAGTDSTVDSTVWDAFLTGMSIGQMEGIKMEREIGDRCEILASIKNLQALHSLELGTCGPILDVKKGNRLISGFAFKHAFRQMPNLRNLHLSGRFKVTETLEKRMSNRFCFDTY